MDKCYTQKTTKKGQTELWGLGVGPLERFGGNPKSFFFLAGLRVQDREEGAEKETKDKRLWEKRERTLPAPPSHRGGRVGWKGEGGSLIDGRYHILKAAGRGKKWLQPAAANASR